jgi:hypothetical protein
MDEMVFCFKRGENNTFKKTSITIDGETADEISVSNGLSVGDEVVTEGGLLLESALSGEGT